MRLVLRAMSAGSWSAVKPYARLKLGWRDTSTTTQLTGWPACVAADFFTVSLQGQETDTHSHHRCV